MNHFKLWRHKSLTMALTVVAAWFLVVLCPSGAALVVGCCFGVVTRFVCCVVSSPVYCKHIEFNSSGTVNQIGKCIQRVAEKYVSENLNKFPLWGKLYKLQLAFTIDRLRIVRAPISEHFYVIQLCICMVYMCLQPGQLWINEKKLKIKTCPFLTT